MSTTDTDIQRITPRTDANLRPETGHLGDYVLAEFARRLERELNLNKRANANQVSRIQYLQEKCDRLRVALEERTDQPTPAAPSPLPAEVWQAIYEILGHEPEISADLHAALAPLWAKQQARAERAEADAVTAHTIACQARLDAERAEAELAESRQYRTGHLPTCAGMDFETMRCGCGYLDGTAYRELVAERDQLRAEVERLTGICRRLEAGIAEGLTKDEAARLRANLAAAREHSQMLSQIAGEVSDFCGPDDTTLDGVRAVLNRLAAAQEDSKRLDWLSENPIHDIRFGLHPNSIIFNGECFVDLRAAIDAARDGGAR